MCMDGLRAGCTWTSFTPGHNERGKWRQRSSWPPTRRSTPVVEVAVVELTTAGGAARLVELVRMRTAATLVRTWALAELVHM